LISVAFEAIASGDKAISKSFKDKARRDKIESQMAKEEEISLDKREET
jgi:hypothetical protein